MSKNELLDRLRDKQLKDIFTQNNIKHLYLVWSYAKWNFSESSDIDLLYEENEDSNNTLFTILNLKSILEKYLNKSVDIADINFLNKYYKESILKNKILLF